MNLLAIDKWQEGITTDASDDGCLSLKMASTINNEQALSTAIAGRVPLW